MMNSLENAMESHRVLKLMTQLNDQPMIGAKSDLKIAWFDTVLLPFYSLSRSKIFNFLKNTKVYKRARLFEEKRDFITQMFDLKRLLRRIEDLEIVFGNIKKRMPKTPFES